MQKLIRRSTLLFGVCAMILAVPRAGLATSPNEPQASARKASIFDSKPSPGYRDRVVYVISDLVQTGTNIPTVYRVYHGTVTPVGGSANRATYYNLPASGSESVVTALFKIDPAITVH